jgi:hypothetical protein
MKLHAICLNCFVWFTWTNQFDIEICPECSPNVGDAQGIHMLVTEQDYPGQANWEHRVWTDGWEHQNTFDEIEAEEDLWYDDPDLWADAHAGSPCPHNEEV